MKANKITVSLFALMLTVALMFSLCTVSVFADTPASEGGTEASTPAESTPAESTPAASTTTGTEEEGKDIVGTIVSLSILGVILVVVALLRGHGRQGTA